MQLKNKELKFELRYRKLLQEYNALLIAISSVSLGIAGLSYTLTKDIISTFFLTSISVIFLYSIKEDKSKELDNYLE